MKNLKSRLFIEALKNFEMNPKKSGKYLNHPGLSADEKKILECWDFLEKEKFTQLLSVLDTIHPVDSLMEAQKYLLLGIVLNHEEQYQMAAPLILKSYEVMKEFSIPQYQLMIIHHLFHSYSHLEDEEGTEYCLEEMKSLGRHLLSSFLKKAA